MGDERGMKVDHIKLIPYGSMKLRYEKTIILKKANPDRMFFK